MTTLSIISSTQDREVDIVFDDRLLAVREYSRRNDKPIAMRTERMLCRFRPSGVTSQMTVEETDMTGQTTSVTTQEVDMGFDLMGWSLHEHLVALDSVVLEAGWDRDT